MSYANRFPSSQHTRYRSSWGPSSVTVFNRADVPRPSPEEEEYAEFYHERLHSAQSRQLLPLQEDLADWINKTLNSEIVSGDNFFDALDNGVVVCRLARIIQEKARTAIDAGKAKGPMPVIKGRCWENAARRSFFSRDNMENFIQFCRRLGVHENLLFESDDLGRCESLIKTLGSISPRVVYLIAIHSTCTFVGNIMGYQLKME